MVEVVKHRFKRSFFLNDKLYILMRVDKMNNIAQCWEYEGEEIRVFIWSDLQRKMRPAWSRTDLSKIFDKHWRTIQNIVLDLHHEGIEVGTFVKNRNEQISSPRQQKFFKTIPRGRWAYSDEDVKTIWRYRAKSGEFATDFPRATAWRGTAWPTMAEIEAKMGLRELHYIKTPEGEFVPTWRSEF